MASSGVRRLAMNKKGGKVEKTMHEFKEGTLHSGSKHGPKVTSRKQAVAIALNQERKAHKQNNSDRHAKLNPMGGVGKSYSQVSGSKCKGMY